MAILLAILAPNGDRASREIIRKTHVSCISRYAHRYAPICRSGKILLATGRQMATVSGEAALHTVIDRHERRVERALTN